MEKHAKQNQSLEKALSIIEIMAVKRMPMRLTDIASLAGLPASTAMRLLNTLELLGYVRQLDSNHKYMLDTKFAGMAAGPVDDDMLAEQAAPVMRSLSDDTDDCVCLGIERDSHVVYLSHVERPGSGLLEGCSLIGKRAPLYCTAEGKFFLISNYSLDSFSKYFRAYADRRFTQTTYVSISEMQMELNRCERHGYALDNEECEVGVSALAVGIRDCNQRVIAAISVVAPAGKLNAAYVRELYPRVQDAAEELSVKFGFSGVFPRGDFNFD